MTAAPTSSIYGSNATTTSLHSPTPINEALRAVIAKENQALALVQAHLPHNSYELVQAMLRTTGRVVWSGTGKSGLVAQKLVATCASLGIPSFFLHPHEALHGDLGMIMHNDLFIALSKSGTGAELSIIIAALKAATIPTALIACANGALTREADIAIVLPFEQEACPHNLAPTSSSTATMAFGDALAIVVSSYKNFGPQDFARFHPAGALGRQLLQVGPIMYKAPNLPLVQEHDRFEDFIVTITEKKMGIGLVVDAAGDLIGIITDGDLRRACKQGPTVFDTTARDVMTHNPKTITPDTLASSALNTMETFSITTLVVTQDRRPIGVLHIHEIIKAGVKKI
jgi:arabinose-5-phosphate isomerase